ncbi:MAG: hypothetical protein J6I52_04275 [Prevotella sp.]|nr:hypothetical protein [Prevotella sp.]
MQQLAWNVFTLTDKVADEETFQNGLEATLAQASPLFVEMTANLSSFQLNFIRAICHGFYTDFSKKEVTSRFPLGTRSNLPRLKTSLTDREIIETDEKGIVLADPLFELWFKREMM